MAIKKNITNEKRQTNEKDKNEHIVKPKKLLKNTCEIEVEKKKNYAILKVFGDITTKTINNIKTKVKDLINEGCINILFELSEVNYIDSAGIGCFVGILKTLKEKHGVLRLVNLNKNIKVIFDLINLSNIFEIFNNLNDATKL